jgi:hypothetical protein
LDPLLRCTSKGTYGAALTDTVALADLVMSATLVAVTVKVPLVAGAVYSPLLEGCSEANPAIKTSLA